MSPDNLIYDVKTYQPDKCVGKLMYQVRAAYMNALDQALGQDPDLAGLEISAAQCVILSVLAERGVDSAAQLCKDISYDGGAMTRMVDRLEAQSARGQSGVHALRRRHLLGLGGAVSAAGGRHLARAADARERRRSRVTRGRRPLRLEAPRDTAGRP
jgi:hypothetical protein